MMRLLVVIGGSGFLGRHLLARSQGWDVTSVDRVPYGPGLPPNVREVVAEGQGSEALRAACRGADAVWVRAGMLGGAASVAIDKAAQYVAANAGLVRSVLAACSETGVKRVLFDSTEQVWGTSGDLERQAADGEPFAGNFYGASKLIAEKTLRMWAHSAPERSVQIFRYTRVRAALTRDVIYHMAAACLAGKRMRIVGNAGHRVSFVHVDDVIAANLAALARVPRFATYQVSADRPYSLFELAQLVREVAGVDVGIDFDRAPAHALSFEPFVTAMEWEESAQRLGVLPRWGVAAMIGETVTALQTAQARAA